MGQCSTLPAEAKNEMSSSSTNYGASSRVQERDDRPTTHHRYRASAMPTPKENMTDTSESSTTPLTARHRGNSSRRQNGYHLQVQTVPQSEQAPTNQTAARFNNMQVHDTQPSSMSPFSPASLHHPQPSPQIRQKHPQHPQQSQMPVPQPMKEERELPAPPESAIRTRCYKLNLESDFVGVNTTADIQGRILGPFAQPPPALTYSASDDSSIGNNPISVAVQTAQIFRGITVAKDGTILSQNARASRSSRGNKMKRGEKSRQAAKIDKAKDLVEETIETGKAPDSDKPANMVSLVIMGEYDEMKYLVRDGSKKLREASSLPDDALLVVNRSRDESSLYRSPLSPSRKRVSPHVPAHIHSSPPSMGKGSPSTSKPRLPHSAPPKLKSHPRDRPNSRRHLHDDRQGSFRHFSPVNDPCNSMFPPPTGGDDWSGLQRGLNSIWNCGGTGTNSPTQNVKDGKSSSYHPTPTGGGGRSHHSQTQQPQQHHHIHQHQPHSNADVRHESSLHRMALARGRPDTERMDAPGPQHAVRA